MNSGAIAKRYADGYLEYVSGTIGFQNGLEELKRAKNIFRKNEPLKNFLKSPEFTPSEKTDILEKVFHDGFSKDTLNFLKLLLKKGRIEELEEIAEYARIKYTHAEEINAVLKTSYMIDTDTLEKIKDILENKLNKKLHLYIDFDADILGGVRIKVGNTIFDGSVRRRLEELKEKLLRINIEGTWQH